MNNQEKLEKLIMDAQIHMAQEAWESAIAIQIGWIFGIIAICCILMALGLQLLKSLYFYYKNNCTK